MGSALNASDTCTIVSFWCLVDDLIKHSGILPKSGRGAAW